MASALCSFVAFLHRFKAVGPRSHTSFRICLLPLSLESALLQYINYAFVLSHVEAGMVDHGAALGNMSLHSTFGKKIRGGF